MKIKLSGYKSGNLEYLKGVMPDLYDELYLEMKLLDHLPNIKFLIDKEEIIGIKISGKIIPNKLFTIQNIKILEIEGSNLDEHVARSINQYNLEYLKISNINKFDFIEYLKPVKYLILDNLSPNYDQHSIQQIVLYAESCEDYIINKNIGYRSENGLSEGIFSRQESLEYLNSIKEISDDIIEHVHQNTNLGDPSRWSNRYHDPYRAYGSTGNQVFYKEARRLQEATGYHYKQAPLHGIPGIFARNFDILNIGMPSADLDKFPEVLLDYTERLEYLDLSYNQFINIPSELYDFENLKTLYMSGNKISVIPEKITELSKLETLVLMDNNIQSVPDYLADLKNLKYLDISNNSIRKLPVNYLINTNAYYIYLDGLPIKTTPVEIDEIINKRKNKSILRLDISVARYFETELARIDKWTRVNPGNI